MSNPVTEARADVAAALSNLGMKVYDYIPERMNAPAAIVTPGSPYVRPGKVFGEFEVTLNVRLYVAPKATNSIITKAMDDLIVSVCAALYEFGVTGVSQPGVDRESYETPHLVSDITITTTYKGGT